MAGRGVFLGRRLDAPCPGHFLVTSSAGDVGARSGYRMRPAQRLRVEWRWRDVTRFAPAALVRVLWAVVLGGVAAVGSFPIVPAIFCCGLGVWHGYAGLAAMLNRTILVVDGEHVEICHGPLLLRRRRVVPREAIVELFCTVRPRRMIEMPATSYQVCHLIAALSDGTLYELVDDLGSWGEAFFLENELRDVLGLQTPPRARAVRAA